MLATLKLAQQPQYLMDHIMSSVVSAFGEVSFIEDDNSVIARGSIFFDSER